ncbi:LacI family DNA-binding transcriptional regulator [Knoellia remsis]|uniref:LacI family DNA-binding transcriptional regulator n=1 Tax=Knoellia remsis TaxID=407159 RepID=UPI0011B2671F|nr:LacI family DNA-binding transcriptional regulator [Knoellia remsis]
MTTSRLPRRTTLKDVAEAAGVSTATASFALSGRLDGPARMSDRTRAHITEVADRLGYVPQFSARSLARGTTDLVAVVLNFPGSRWAGAVTDAITDAVGALGAVTVSLAHERWAEHLRRGFAGAAFVEDWPGREDSDLAAIARLGTTLMVASREAPSRPAYDVVVSNEYSACREMVEGLLTRGHRRIGVLRRSHDEEHHAPNERLRAYLDAVDAAGQQPVKSLVRFARNRYDLAYAETTQLLALPEPPTAIYAMNGPSAAGALWATQAAGARDVEVVGVDPVGDLQTQPELSWVTIAEGEMARMGRRMADRITDPSLPVTELELHWVLRRPG